MKNLFNLLTLMLAVRGAEKLSDCFENAKSSIGRRAAYYRSTPFSDRDALGSGLFESGMKIESISYCESEMERLSFIQLGLW